MNITTPNILAYWDNILPNKTINLMKIYYGH